MSEYDPFRAAQLRAIRSDAEYWVGRTGNGFSPFTVLRLLATIDEANEMEERLASGDKMTLELRGLLQAWEPRVSCPQCGQRYTKTACGPTHAIVANLVFPSGDGDHHAQG
jgi:hypothetical protein